MKQKTAEWFEVSVKYDQQDENGLPAPILEQYTVEAFSFTEAEETILEDRKPYIIGEFDVKNIKKAPYKEVFFSENPNDDKWYKAKVQFITLDEKSGKEKRATHTYLVQSNKFENAVKNVTTVLNTGMQDWVITSVNETKIMDVIEHQIAVTPESEE